MCAFTRIARRALNDALHLKYRSGCDPNRWRGDRSALWFIGLLF
jgi:hypothetical protein